MCYETEIHYKSRSSDSEFLQVFAMDSDTSTGVTAVCRPKRVLIIGGGPTGLVSLRNLKERGSFDSVELYERRDDVGGVW